MNFEALRAIPRRGDPLYLGERRGLSRSTAITLSASNLCARRSRWTRRPDRRRGYRRPTTRSPGAHGAPSSRRRASPFPRCLAPETKLRSRRRRVDLRPVRPRQASSDEATGRLGAPEAPPGRIGRSQDLIDSRGVTASRSPCHGVSASRACTSPTVVPGRTGEPRHVDSLAGERPRVPGWLR